MSQNRGVCRPERESCWVWGWSPGDHLSTPLQGPTASAPPREAPAALQHRREAGLWHSQIHRKEARPLDCLYCFRQGRDARMASVGGMEGSGGESVTEEPVHPINQVRNDISSFVIL